ncbi:hypothetical protein LPH60_00035 [Xylella taiwanensis]|nr:hypothetical protein [Xylella taiwanensis]MCD8468831.1 hypothetical protein [Xylella taiwanensis]
MAAGGAEDAGTDAHVLGPGGALAQVGLGAGDAQGALAAQGAAGAEKGGGVDLQGPLPAVLYGAAAVIQGGGVEGEGAAGAG